METKGTVKRMNKEDRRKLILEAAMTVFVEKGYKGSTTLEIAKTAGISEVTLFRYFKSKQELFLQGIEPILFSTLESSVNILGTESPEQKLENILFERISLISKNYQVVKLILSEESLLTGLGSSNFMNRIIQILKTTLAQIGISINDKDLNLRLLMGSMLSFLYMPEKNEETIREYVGKVASLILRENKKIEMDNNT